MLNSGAVRYEVGANIDATAFGGIAAVHRLVTRLGLVDRIDEDLQLLKVHLPYHESDHVLNLAYNVACGGTRLEDIERLRHDSAYMNALGADLIPDPTTAGDFCRRFTEADVATLMEAINAVRPQLWAGRGRDLLGPIAYLDVDGTIAPTCGRAQGRDGHVLQGHLGVRAADRVAGQHQGGALPGQPARQRAQPRRRGGLDRQGDRPGRPARRAGVPARGHRLLADRALRPMGPAGRFRVRHGLPTRRCAPAPRRCPRRPGHHCGGPTPPRRAAGSGANANPTTSGASSPNAAMSTSNSTSRTSPSSATSPASAPDPTG